MDVAYVFEKDASSPDIQSGRPASILREFQRVGFNVHRCFPLPMTSGPIERIEQRLARLVRKRYFKGRSNRQLRQMAREAEAKLQGIRCDFVFSPGTLPLAYLRTRRPVAFSSDCTFQSMIGYYPEFSRLSGLQRREFERAERAALGKSQLLVYASEWAAQSAIDHYGIPPERVAAIPSGANLGAENRRDLVDGFIAARPSDRTDILFIGKDWARKGGPICLEATRLLNAAGRPATLHIVGCTPPVSSECQPFVEIHGLLQPSVSAQRKKLESLFRRAHFLFVPSRAEAYGMAFCEANAFGVPAISTATGGVPTIVRSGVNGVVLPLEAPAAAYIEVLVGLAADRDRYVAMARRSFEEFERRLNWRAWIEAFVPRIEQAVARAGATVPADSSGLARQP